MALRYHAGIARGRIRKFAQTQPSGQMHGYAELCGWEIYHNIIDGIHEVDVAAELGRNAASTRSSLSMEMSKMMRDGIAKIVSRDQILRRERRQGNIHSPYSADHEQNWQPDQVDPSLAICDDHTFIQILYTSAPYPSICPLTLYYLINYMGGVALIVHVRTCDISANWRLVNVNLARKREIASNQI